MSKLNRVEVLVKHPVSIIGPAFLFFYLFSVTHGNNAFLALICGYGLYLLFRVFNRKLEQTRFKLLGLSLTCMCVLVSVGAQFSLPASRTYIASLALSLGLAVLYLEMEQSLFRSEIRWPTTLVWFIGGIYIVACVAALLNQEYVYLFLFKKDGGAISHYLSGWPRFYTITAVCFLVFPAKGYFKLISFVLTALPASPVNIVAWLFLHINKYYVSLLLILVVCISLFSIGVSGIIDFMGSLYALKEGSIDGRLQKLSGLSLWGSSHGYNDNFAEAFWFACAQIVGVIPSFLLFSLFFVYIFKLSRNWFFLGGCFLLTMVNPFPLALLVLLAPSWKKAPNHRRKYA